MSSGTFPAEASQPTEFSARAERIARAVLAPIASLRLTVILFALAIFIIFVGTLAQVDKDMWDVIDIYFRSIVAWIDVQVFFPRTWFPDLAGKVPGKFPAPGGLAIGIAMALNLLAAHLIRFKVQAKGFELLLGLATIAIGCVITWLVIASGHSSGGLQGEPPFSWATMWVGIRVGLFLTAVASGIALAMSKSSAQTRVGWLSVAIVSGALGAWSMTTVPSDASLRILWQLIQGGLVGLVLLGGCLIVFKKRAGIVLLHAGILLMMFSEFFVGLYAQEGRMTIREGETVNYLRDIRSVELAVVDASKPDTEDVVVVPGSRLVPKRSLWGGTPKEKILIQDEKLPFDIHVEKFIKNARLLDANPSDVTLARELNFVDEKQLSVAARMFQENGEQGSFVDVLVEQGFLTKQQLDELAKIRQDRISNNYADQGVGKQLIAQEVRAASGTDGGEVDMGAAYVEFRKKGTEESLGKYLLSQVVAANDRAEKIEVDGKTYDVTLRFKRDYKDYSISLKDVRKDDYLGTNTPMNYSSDVILTEGDEKIGDFRIWMNNPLRYAGETFYQSGYNVIDGGEVTDLQVVTNRGWMMPYVGCMLVAVGMLVHFSFTLRRFLGGVSKQRLQQSEVTTVWSYAIPALVVLVCAAYVGSKLRAPDDTKANMRIHDFGKLPVVYQGRVKPLDTLARNTLRIVSNKETFDDEARRKSENSRRVPQLPAIRWLLDVMSGSPEAKKHRVYRIDNLDLLATLDLNRRKGFRYAEEEFEDKIPELEKQIAEARELEPEDRSFYQHKLIELEGRIRAVRLIEAAFARIFPPVPTQAEFEQDREAAMRRLMQIKDLMDNSARLQAMLRQMQPPLAVPVGGEDGWMAFSTAWNDDYMAQFNPEAAAVPPATLLWKDMMGGYARGETKVFNDALDAYQAFLAENTPENVDTAKVGFEHFFNHFQPFKYSIVLYIFAFVLIALGWLLVSVGGFSTLNRTAFWLVVFTFLLHTFALGARVYISGRPPITNLYSSAVFIGWAAVGLGLILERLYGMGIGNALAAMSGFLTLLIAYALAADGDTFTVLQAVLDTQFWLATHVVCVTLGYSTTFAAGFLGVIYLLSMAWRSRWGKPLASMIYGTLCFAIFFSFVGTVLGGLWADDSWGRFWGWDPKENGALIIVLWNALILHARWGGMVRQRGLAMLAVIGNITTAWSWFGVNELGVGLHSYGFTEGVLLYLGVFVLSQLLLVMLAGAVMLYQGSNEASKSLSPG